jgi:hypothetical protein
MLRDPRNEPTLGVDELYSATGLVWEFWHTGGGCTALAARRDANDPNSAYVMLTSDCSAPCVGVDTFVTLGLYPDYQETSEWDSFADLGSEDSEPFTLEELLIFVINKLDEWWNILG